MRRRRWVPALAVAAALGAAVPATVTGLLLTQDLKPSNFCRTVEVDTARALRNVRLRRWHQKAALPVAACLAIAVAYGAAAGAQRSRGWQRWAAAVLSVLALGAFLAANYTGQKEAWQLLSPSLAGWAKIPWPGGQLPSDLGLSPAHPECEPHVRASLEHRVATIYWVHMGSGLAMAILAVLLGVLGTTWRRPEPGT